MEQGGAGEQGRSKDHRKQNLGQAQRARSRLDKAQAAPPESGPRLVEARQDRNGLGQGQYVVHIHSSARILQVQLWHPATTNLEVM